MTLREEIQDINEILALEWNGNEEFVEVKDVEEAVAELKKRIKESVGGEAGLYYQLEDDIDEVFGL